MTPLQIFIITVLFLAVTVCGIFFIWMMKGAFLAVLEELRAAREARERRDKQRATELAGVISDLRDGQEGALRVVGEVIERVIDSNNNPGGGKWQKEEVAELIVKAINPGIDERLNNDPEFDDFMGTVPPNRELVGDLRPGQGIPGIGDMGVGWGTDDVSTAGEEYDG